MHGGRRQENEQGNESAGQVSSKIEDEQMEQEEGTRPSEEDEEVMTVFESASGEERSQGFAAVSIESADFVGLINMCSHARTLPMPISLFSAASDVGPTQVIFPS